MESIVNCPYCNEHVPVIIKPYEDSISGLMEFLDGQMGLGKTDHFQGDAKCQCGKTVIVSLHVTGGGV